MKNRNPPPPIRYTTCTFPSGGPALAEANYRWPRSVSVGTYCCATSGDEVRTVKLLPPPVRFASQLASYWI